MKGLSLSSHTNLLLRKIAIARSNGLGLPSTEKVEIQGVIPLELPTIARTSA